MRRLLSFLTALVLFVVIITGYFYNVNNDESVFIANTRADYWLDGIKYKSSDFVSANITDETILVLGSSELGTTYIDTHPVYLFCDKGYNYDTMLIGEGHYQSLWHAINLGALSKSPKIKKAVFIVSPQWFTEEGISSDAFTGTYSQSTYYSFMDNENISKETKQKVTNRLGEVMPDQKDNFDHINSTWYDSYNIFAKISYYINYKNSQRKSIVKAVTEYNKIIKNDVNVSKSITEINWNSLMQKAETEGEAACTNNPFGIRDSYYTEYINEKFSTLKGSYASQSYAVSKEYDDLKLFLDVCKETNIEPLIIVVPVNGAWYDYAEFSKTDRQNYYSNVKKICENYSAEVADFSNKEYEKYFLCDIMHLGWKGWVYVNEAICKFYTENQE